LNLARHQSHRGGQEFESPQLLNHAIFHSIYVDDDQIADHSLREPFAQLHAVQSDWQTADVTVPEPRTSMSRALSERFSVVVVRRSPRRRRWRAMLACSVRRTANL
jgi:hypothetical protein